MKIRNYGLCLVAVLVSACTDMPPQVNQGIRAVTPARSVPQLKQDYEIRREVSSRLYRTDDQFKNSEIYLDGIYGSVLLSGRVPDLRLKKVAGQRARAVPGVVSVHNYITVGAAFNNSERLADQQINQQIEQLLQSRPLVKMLDYSVQSRDRTVYVMGRMPRKDFNGLMTQLQTLKNVRRIVSLIDFV